jgi:predicted dithiol-disulfide oxidoreductase (DUF899 family)
MQEHRVIALDEWFPARRRRLSTENEVSRRRDQWAERRRNEGGAEFDLSNRMRRDDRDEERILTSAA